MVLAGTMTGLTIGAIADKIKNSKTQKAALNEEV